MPNDFQRFIDEGTNKLLEILSSAEIDEQEKTAIISAFTDELSAHIANHKGIPDYNRAIYIASINYTDRKLANILSKEKTSFREMDEASALCHRMKDLVGQFKAQNWDLPNIRCNDIIACEKQINTRRMTELLEDRLSDLDAQIYIAIAKAEREVSSEACSEVISLLEEMNFALKTPGAQRTILHAPKNRNIQKLYKKIAIIQKEAEQKEALYQKIAASDGNLYGIEFNDETTYAEWKDAVANCDQLFSYMSECEKNRWILPEMHCIDLETIKKKYCHYLRMLELDKELSECEDTIKSHRKYKHFLKCCTEQTENIDECKRNNWQVPELVNPDPDAMGQDAANQMAQRTRKRRFKARLITAAVTIVFIIFSIFFLAHKSREGKITIPFSSTYVVGIDCNTLKKELVTAGFTNIQMVEDDSGWLKDNEVIAVTVDNYKEFSKDEYYEPDVSVVITYSSNERVDISKSLGDWQTCTYTDIIADLKSAGFTNITTTAQNSSEKNKNQKVFKITVNEITYKNGHCYVPKDAPIDITYYKLMITMSNDNTSFIGQNYEAVVKSLTDDGFTNVRTEKYNSGWAKANTVTAVTINNQTSYDSEDVYSPDVKIVVKYSSDNRVNITSTMANWDSKNYKKLEQALRTAGLTNIITKESETSTHSKNQKVAGVTFYGENFTGGECYLPETTPIVIKYYNLKLSIRNSASDYEKRNYTEVVEELKKAGFTNIVLKRTNKMGLLSWFTEEGSIKSISIDNKVDFTANESFAYDSKIIIVVNTYEGKGCEDIKIVAK